MTRRQRRALQKRIAKRLKELGDFELAAHEQAALDRGAGYNSLLRRIDETAGFLDLGGLNDFGHLYGLDDLY
jgi:hypothetical protein